MIIKHAPLLFLLAGVVPAHAADADAADEIYAGRVGQQEVVLCRGERLDSARYYYKKHGVDIPLRSPTEDASGSPASIPAGDAVFTYKEAGSAEEERPTWLVQKKGDKIVGTLSLPKKDTPLLVDLRLVQRIEAKSGISKACEPSTDFEQAMGSYYERTKIDRPVQITKTIRQGEIVLEQVFEPVSKTSGFRLVAHPDAKVRVKLSRYFEQKFKQEIYDSLDCKSQANLLDAPEGGYEQSVKIAYFTDKVFSVSERSTSFCGGAHPNGGEIGKSIDLTTGQELQRGDIFKKEFVDARSFSEQFKSFLVNYFKKAKLPEGEDLSECTDLTYLSVWLAKDGVWLSGGDYREHECGEPFLISYDNLRETLNEGLLRKLGVGPHSN